MTSEEKYARCGIFDLSKPIPKPKRRKGKK